MTSLFARTRTFPVVNGTELFTLPPPGYELNLDNPQQIHDTAHYVIFGIGEAVASIALIQRLYTKAFLSNGLHADDREY